MLRCGSRSWRRESCRPFSVASRCKCSNKDVHRSQSIGGPPSGFSRKTLPHRWLFLTPCSISPVEDTSTKLHGLCMWPSTIVAACVRKAAPIGPLRRSSTANEPTRPRFAQRGAPHRVRPRASWEKHDRRGLLNAGTLCHISRSSRPASALPAGWGERLKRPALPTRRTGFAKVTAQWPTASTDCSIGFSPVGCFRGLGLR